MSGRALVTGAASGLGRAMATRFVREGWRVLLTDIDAEALAEVEAELARSATPGGAEGEDGGRGTMVVARRLDVTDDADWMRARQWCEDTWGGLDLLVNNAGVAAGGRMELTSMEDWDWILELNLKSVVRGCRTFIPLFKQQGSGYIVNTASLAGIAMIPAMASYNTTKAGVIALSQTLRYELKPFGIGVSVVAPGFVNTNLGSSMRSSDPEAVRRAQQMISGATVSAEHVADKVYDGVQKRRFLVLTHREGYLVYAMRRISPALLERAVVGQWEKIRRRFDQAAPTGEGVR